MKSYYLNQVVVITGAASGMGRAYAKAFAEAGAKLALTDIDEEGLKETVALLNQPVAVMHRAFSVADEDACASFASEVSDQLGHADIVINNAGVEGSGQPVWGSSTADFKRVMDINYYGVLYMTQAFLPEMQARNSGKILNVSSIFGFVGAPNHADYCASKFAVRGFTEALMAELQETEIDVYLLHPGGIQTGIAHHGHSQRFAQHFFQTTSEEIAAHVLKALKRRSPRIVYGHSSLKTALASRLLPLSLLKQMIWKELKPVIDLSQYK